MRHTLMVHSSHEPSSSPHKDRDSKVLSAPLSSAIPERWRYGTHRPHDDTGERTLTSAILLKTPAVHRSVPSCERWRQVTHHKVTPLWARPHSQTDPGGARVVCISSTVSYTNPNYTGQ